MHLLAQQHAERDRVRRPIRDRPQEDESHQSGSSGKQFT